MVLKIDLSKAYDRVSWIYLQVILTKMGFGVPFITWVMSSLTSVSFSVLINGVASSFFRSGRALRPGCPLAALLFLVVAEGFRTALVRGLSLLSYRLLNLLFYPIKV